MEFKGSRTEKNLLVAFAGEFQARNRYTYFASKAKKEGYEQIFGYLSHTADNEKEHAKLFFNLLKGGEAEIVVLLSCRGHWRCGRQSEGCRRWRKF